MHLFFDLNFPPQDAATKAALRALTLAYEGHGSIGYPVRLLGAEAKLGCACISVGSEIAADLSAPNVASSVGRALNSIYRFFNFASRPPASATELGMAFAAIEARAANLDSSISCAEGGKIRNAATDLSGNPRRVSSSLFGRIFGGNYAFRSSASKKSGIQQHVVSNSLSVTDFDLLRVVGKGAFGKVMLVRKKHGQVSSYLISVLFPAPCSI